MDPEGPTDRTSGTVDDAGRQWMLAFQAGDDSAFDRLVTEFHAPVAHFLLRYVDDRDRAEDLAQEAFLRVFRARKRYRPSASFKTWLFTIATRLALNEIRSIRRRRRALGGGIPWEAPGPGSSLEEVGDTRQAQPHVRIELLELQDVLGVLLSELPANQRAAILLSSMEELSYREIGEVLGVTPVAVKSLVMRGRETLRVRLARYEHGRPMSERASLQADDGERGEKSDGT